MWSQLALSLQNGNPYLMVILALAFFGTIIIFERFFMLMFVYNIDFSRFLSNFRRAVQSDDLDRAASICKGESKTSLPLISLKALEANDRDPSTVRGIIEEETIDFLPRVEARLTILPSLSTTILLIGVLGTIDGLWEVFNSIEILDTSEKQARLANGITESLNPTTLGLIVCIVFLSFHQVLKGSAIRLTEKIHHGVSVLTNLLAPAEIMPAFVASPDLANMAPAQMAMPSDVSSVSNDINISDADDSDLVEDSDHDSFDNASVEDIKDEEEII